MTLWPETARHVLKLGADREIKTIYLHNRRVPIAVWRDLFAKASRQIDVSSTDFYFLWDVVPDLSDVLREKVRGGCQVRFILGVSTDPLVEADEKSVGDIPLKLSTRMDQTRTMLEPLRDVVGVRESPLGYGRSIFRGDDTALLVVWPHRVWGGDFPLLHLVRRQDGGVFDQLTVRHVDRLWEDAAPVSWPAGDEPGD